MQYNLLAKSKHLEAKAVTRGWSLYYDHRNSELGSQYPCWEAQNSLKVHPKGDPLVSPAPIHCCTHQHMHTSIHTEVKKKMNLKTKNKHLIAPQDHDVTLNTHGHFKLNINIRGHERHKDTDYVRECIASKHPKTTATS